MKFPMGNASTNGASTATHLPIGSMENDFIVRKRLSAKMTEILVSPCQEKNTWGFTWKNIRETDS